jgi:hypothetical protein
LLENGQSGDVWKFPAHALTGVTWTWEKEVRKISGFTFIVTEPFLKGVPGGLRAALKSSGILFVGTEEFKSKGETAGLIWPASREDALFFKTALAVRKNFRDARGAELFQVTHQAIKLNPGQPEFIGLKRSPHHGIIYEAREDYFARFDPEETEISAADYAFAGSAGLAGLALDGSMRMCAIFDPAQAKAGFAPPQNKLIRFIPKDELPRVSGEDPQFTCLGLLEA